jgi:hypothetical protein
MFRPLYPRGKSLRYALHRRLGGPQNRCRQPGGKKDLAPTGTRTPIPRQSSTQPYRCIWAKRNKKEFWLQTESYRTNMLFDFRLYLPTFYEFLAEFLIFGFKSASLCRYHVTDLCRIKFSLRYEMSIKFSSKSSRITFKKHSYNFKDNIKMGLLTIY